MAETRRWDVRALERRVRVFTEERRMASLGVFFAAWEGVERVRSASSVGEMRGRRCIFAVVDAD